MKFDGETESTAICALACLPLCLISQSLCVLGCEGKQLDLTCLYGRSITKLLCDPNGMAIGGFSGPDPAVSELATAWVQRRGGSWSLNTRGRLLSFASVAERPPAVGVLRQAGAASTEEIALPRAA